MNEIKLTAEQKAFIASKKGIVHAEDGWNIVTVTSKKAAREVAEWLIGTQSVICVNRKGY